MFLKISFFQYCPIFNDINANLVNVKGLLKDNADAINESDLVVFPEYFLSGSLDLNQLPAYKDQLAKISIGEELGLISKCYPSTTFVFGSALLFTNEVFYNQCLVYKGGNIVIKYEKKALIYNENHICKSTSNYPVFEVDGHRVGIAICWDLILPEVFRKYTGQVDLVIVPALWAIGGNALQAQYSHSLEKTYYRQLLTTRAYENSIAILFVNSVGKYNSPFWNDRMMGGSLAVMPPIGEIYFTNSKNPKELHSIDMDFKPLTKFREFYATDVDFNFYKSKNIF